MDSSIIQARLQSLERAGDHAKNMAEEVCHLVSGHTLRHALRANGRSYEQMFLDWLKVHTPAKK